VKPRVAVVVGVEPVRVVKLQIRGRPPLPQGLVVAQLPATANVAGEPARASQSPITSPARGAPRIRNPNPRTSITAI
jgi:hypothetical protein